MTGDIFLLLVAIFMFTAGYVGGLKLGRVQGYEDGYKAAQKEEK